MPNSAPPCCYSCGSQFGHWKFRYFCKVRRDRYLENNKATLATITSNSEIELDSAENVFMGDIMDDLGVINQCCRIRYITNCNQE